MRDAFISTSCAADGKEFVSGHYDSFSRTGWHYSKSDFLNLSPYNTVYRDRSCYSICLVCLEYGLIIKFPI